MFTTIIICAVIVSLYFYGTRNFNYWKVRGIKHDKPYPFIGTNFKNYVHIKSMTQMATDMYFKYPEEKVVGYIRGNRPELVIRDPEIIKRIILTDFSYFYPRGLNANKNAVEPLMHNLFFVDGDEWRLLRQRMTPTFTSGKLKAMFPLIVERAEKLQVRALAAASKARPIDARDLMARYTIDFIGACGFGLDADSLNDDDSEFRKLGVKIFTPNVLDILVIFLKDLFPELCGNLKYLGKVETEIFDLVRQILQQRNYEPCGRNDFVDLLLECRNKGVMVGESIEKVNPDGSPVQISLELTEKLIAAQIFVFFAAGFETSSSATSFTLHQLAFNPKVQSKVQEEIDRVLAKHNNKLSYEAVKEMTYLEWTFNEGMRMFPSLGFLIRECARPYTIPELNVTIDPLVGVIIPLQALHNDPEYFENPSEFRPERFDPNEYNTEKNKYIYMPFGDGPRACIGARLGLMQSMAGLAAILSKFTVEPAPNSLRIPQVEPWSDIVQSIRNGLPLTFRERTSAVL